MPAAALVIPPRVLSLTLHRLRQCSSTTPQIIDLQHPQLRFYTSAPLRFRRNIPRPVSYYAFFKGLLLLSKPPGCLGGTTSFPTQYKIWDLS